jgi:hypothetical protein
VATTDATARRKFRLYWAAFSAGIILIRRVMIREIKNAAEREGRAAAAVDILGRPHDAAPHHTAC